ncbi:MAG: hypothetical protein AABY16_01020 [Nanoarchaeota archaeon]
MTGLVSLLSVRPVGPEIEFNMYYQLHGGSERGVETVQYESLQRGRFLGVIPVMTKRFYPPHLDYGNHEVPGFDEHHCFPSMTFFALLSEFRRRQIEQGAFE